jgi:hypothetical protein
VENPGQKPVPAACGGATRPAAASAERKDLFLTIFLLFPPLDLGHSRVHFPSATVRIYRINTGVLLFSTRCRGPTAVPFVQEYARQTKFIYFLYPCKVTVRTIALHRSAVAQLQVCIVLAAADW